MAVFVPSKGGDGRCEQYSGRWTFLLTVGIVTAMMLGFSYGFDLGVTGGVTGMTTFRSYFFPDLHVTSNSGMWCHFNSPQLQLVTSTAYIASVPATFAAFWLCGWRGRCLVVFLGALAYTIAAGLQAGAQNQAMLYSGRALVGIGMAFGNQAAPVWMSEVALPKIRGALVSFYQLAVVVGILVANLVNYGMGKASWNGWRLSLGLYAAATIPAMLVAPLLPDSPDSYISRKLPAKGRRALERLRGTPNVDLEWEDIVEETMGNEAKKRALMSHFSSRQHFEVSQFRSTLKWAYQYRVHFLLCFLLGAFRALTGNPLLLFYAPELFQTLGTSQNYSLLSAVVQGSFKVAGCLGCIFLVDRVGRKKLQVIGGIGQLVMQVAAALITGVWFNRSGVDDSDAWALTIVLCLFEVFFELSICTLSWVIATEICPLEIRSIGAGFHVMGDLCLQIFFSQMTLTMMCAMQYGVFILSAFFCLVFIVFSIWFIPETRGVPLDQVQERLRTHWLWKRYMKELQAAADRAAEAAEAEAYKQALHSSPDDEHEQDANEKPSGSPKQPGSQALTEGAPSAAAASAAAEPADARPPAV